MKITSGRSDGYEVSSKGDRRFSAFNARLSDGRSIEEWYQCDIKGYDPGGRNWRLGKGKQPLSPRSPLQLYTEYLALWQEWAKENGSLMLELREHAEAKGGRLCDRFASTPINQARALADILNAAPF